MSRISGGCSTSAIAIAAAARECCAARALLAGWAAPPPGHVACQAEGGTGRCMQASGERHGLQHRHKASDGSAASGGWAASPAAARRRWCKAFAAARAAQCTRRLRRGPSRRPAAAAARLGARLGGGWRRPAGSFADPTVLRSAGLGRSARQQRRGPTTAPFWRGSRQQLGQQALQGSPSLPTRLRDCRRSVAS